MHDDVVLTGPDFRLQHDVNNQMPDSESNRTTSIYSRGDSESPEVDSNVGSDNLVGSGGTLSEKSAYHCGCL